MRRGTANSSCRTAGFEDLLRRLDKATEPELKEMTAMALLNIGYAWGELNRRDDELAAYDALLKRFSASKDPDLQAQVAQALYNKGVTLQAMNRVKAAEKPLREIVNRFEKARGEELRELVESARISLAEGDPVVDSPTARNGH